MNNPVPLEYVTSFAQTNQALMLQLATPLLTSGEHGADFNRLAEVAQVQQDYLQRMSALWLSTMTHAAGAPIQPAKGDRRFASEEWRKSPLHDFLKQSYLINIRYVSDLIERSSVDERTRRKLRFFARQILDALSPSNYLATNPQSLRRAMDTGGDSLAAGIKNLIDDVGKGRISVTDEKAFEVGGNLAVTPGAVILQAAHRRSGHTAARHGPARHQQVLRVRFAAWQFVRPLRRRAGPYGLHGLMAQHHCGSGSFDLG